MPINLATSLLVSSGNYFFTISLLLFKNRKKGVRGGLDLMFLDVSCFFSWIRSFLDMAEVRSSCSVLPTFFWWVRKPKSSISSIFKAYGSKSVSFYFLVFPCSSKFIVFGWRDVWSINFGRVLLKAPRALYNFNVILKIYIKFYFAMLIL